MLKNSYMEGYMRAMKDLHVALDSYADSCFESTNLNEDEYNGIVKFVDMLKNHLEEVLEANEEVNVGDDDNG